MRHLNHVVGLFRAGQLIKSSDTQLWATGRIKHVCDENLSAAVTATYGNTEHPRARHVGSAFEEYFYYSRYKPVLKLDQGQCAMAVNGLFSVAFFSSGRQRLKGTKILNFKTFENIQSNKGQVPFHRCDENMRVVC